MRSKLLRGKQDVTVQFVYPSTADEYCQALDILGRSVDAASARADCDDVVDPALRSAESAGARPLGSSSPWAQR